MDERGKTCHYEPDIVLEKYILFRSRSRKTAGKGFMPLKQKIYRIGEVAAILEVRTSVLRFWETKFPELLPKRMSSGHRGYTHEDVQLLRRIKDLLYTRGLTIEGARQVLEKSLPLSSLTEEEVQARSQELEERQRELAERRREQETAFLQEVCEELKAVRTLLTQGGGQ